MSQLVVLSLHGESYGLPIERVQEIVRWIAPRSLPGAAPAIAGIVNLRGQTIPVVELGTLFGVEPTDENGKIVVVETSAGLLGLLVDGVDQVLDVGDAPLDALPAGDIGAIVGLVKAGEQLIVQIDGDAIAAAVELADAFAADVAV